ncbi:MAG: hypothetical protein HYT43_00945 [Candidatus Taylorbacteria bacterium]|nr:hypothetical protein [Candidatus Taylorbacteria bacterium]
MNRLIRTCLSPLASLFGGRVGLGPRSPVKRFLVEEERIAPASIPVSGRVESVEDIPIIDADSAIKVLRPGRPPRKAIFISREGNKLVAKIQYERDGFVVLSRKNGSPFVRRSR